MFYFAHVFKSWDYFEGVDDFEAADRLECIMEKKSTTWEDVEDAFDCTDARAQFCTMWNEIKFPADLFTRAVAFAKRQPFPLERPMSPKYALFVSICAAAQRLNPEPTFPLSVVQFAKVIGVNRNMITAYKKRAIKDGLLVIVKREIPQRQAARARFTGGRKESTHAITRSPVSQDPPW